MKKAFIRRKESHITVMITSNPDEGIKNFRINKNLLRSVALFSALLLIYSATLSMGYLRLDKNNNVALNNIAYLEKENSRQSAEISGLYSYSDKVRQEMEDFIEFDGEIRDMVGLESECDKRLEEFHQQLQGGLGGTLIASRGRRVPNLSELEREQVLKIAAAPAPTVMMSSMNSLDDAVQVLAEQIDIQQEEMDKLLTDVDARLKYLEAKPTFLPVSGTITSRFGSRKHPFTKKYDFHGAVDIAAKSGTAIRVPGKGVVTFSGRKSGYGNIIEVSHGYGIKTRYAHNSSNLVKKGDNVSKGQMIARVGSTGTSTGPHVHFEIEVNGKLVDPIKFVNSKT